MRKGIITNKIVLLFVIAFLTIVFHLNLTSIVAQETKQEKCDKLFDCLEKFNKECYGDEFLNTYSPKLVDKFNTKITHEEEMLSLDALVGMLHLAPNATGYIVVYGGRMNKYAEYQIRVERVNDYIKYRKFDSSRIKILHGGFREQFEFELWTSEIKNAFPPLSPTVSPEKVLYKGRMKPFTP